MTSTITLRPPTFSPAKAPAGFQQPSIQWLTETWHVTHSTLPMWKSKRNVRITYKPLPPSNSSLTLENTDRMDDIVTYQPFDGDKVSTIKGIDSASSSSTATSGASTSVSAAGEWDWRGKGWLKIASSHWEILGWGEEEGGNKWAVTMFAKTMFTPAGIDVYSRDPTELRPESLEGIKKALMEVEDGSVRKLAGELFEVKIG